jgi:superfamily II RNA helicase
MESVSPPLRTQDADVIFDAFLERTAAKKIELYPAQEEAIMELMAGKHVILNTPTGSGKSLVATALHFKGLAEGRRSFYTCPIKALVSEKFFALCQEFGAAHVGMLTGDASINKGASIICCTAEILANMALCDGKDAAVDYVIMDEFHYYSDPDRGVAWQIPLLTLPQVKFLLMSATLGDITPIAESIEKLTGTSVAHVRSSQRPVPLDFEYKESPLHETLAELMASRKYPVYVVNFSQRECVEQAQNVLSVDFCSKPEKAAIAQALAGFRFDSPFGKDMRRYISHGVGLHHAGLLPKYRLLVEKLAQEGLLKIIMGTDTLGVGVNVPIRTVLFTRLCKYDGEKTGILKVRDFKQIAGRAGRKGYDDQGSVMAQAPEHVIENKRMESRVADNPAKKRKLVKKKPPARNYVPWDATTFRKLIDDPPETLHSRFSITHAMLLNLLQASPEGYRRLVQMVGSCHDAPAQKSRHRRYAAILLRSLRQAGIVSVVHNRRSGNRLTVNETLQNDFSINQSLTLYLVDTVQHMDRQSPTYALDVLTLVESILEDPHMILAKQIDKLRGIKLAELKADGVEYEERIAELEKIEHPKPNREFIYDTFNAYAAKHPWVTASKEVQSIRPKSVARELYERCASFAEYVREYSLQRSEGVVLRYLSQVYKTLTQSVPEGFADEMLEDTAVFLRTLLGFVDSSLVQEWESLLQPADAPPTAAATPKKRRLAIDPQDNPRAFAARLRTEMHRLVKALSQRDYEEALQCLRPAAEATAEATAEAKGKPTGEPITETNNEANPPANSLPPEPPLWTVDLLTTALGPYWDEHKKIIFDPAARQARLTHIKQLGPTTWQVVQTLCDPSDENLWAVHAEVEISDVRDPELPLLALQRIGT